MFSATLQYWWFLAGISLLFVVLERIWPWRRDQRVLRRGVLIDVFYLVFNGHFFGLLLGRALGPLSPHLDAAGAAIGLTSLRFAATWPLWLQTLVAVISLDFTQWWIHRSLHRFGVLWKLHQVHHSITQLDWIGVMRFHWLEVVVYKAAQYVPLVAFGFSADALFFFAVFGTFMGHFNHANLRVKLGPLGYIFNSPRMHIWHHNNDAGEPHAVNFGISLSLWDYIFRTAYLPADPPRALGVPDAEGPPESLWRQLIWPLRVGRRTASHDADDPSDDPPLASG